MGKVLVVTSNPALRERVGAHLRGSGNQVVAPASIQEAAARIEQELFDLVVADLADRSNGPPVWQMVQRLNPATGILLLADPDEAAEGIRAMREGAYDYLVKPVDLEELELRARRALEHRRLVGEVDYLHHEQPYIYRFEHIIGESPAMKKVFAVLRKVAKSKATIFVTGETGTGKELIAGAIHRNSPRATMNFVKVNCAALPENLLESELFGHERGAFTGADKQRIGRFEQANYGTMFLDEIGDMSPSTQAKVLRVLQEQEFERLGGTKTIKVDVRLIAATNKELRRAVESGDFREDLYYRLDVVSLRLPPLRERREDILSLAGHFVRKYCGEFGRRPKVLSPEAERSLLDYSWPGNVRELENAIERAVLLTESSVIGPHDFTFEGLPLGRSEGAAAPLHLPPQGVRLAEVERGLLLEALRMSNWVQKDAARLLGISRRVMNYKIKKHGIRSPRWIRNRGPTSGEMPGVAG